MLSNAFGSRVFLLPCRMCNASRRVQGDKRGCLIRASDSAGIGTALWRASQRPTPRIDKMHRSN